MSLSSIATDCNGPPEAAHAQIDDDRYDLVQRGSAGQLQLDLSDQLNRSSIASTNTISVSSANELV